MGFRTKYYNIASLTIIILMWTRRLVNSHTFRFTRVFLADLKSIWTKNQLIRNTELCPPNRIRKKENVQFYVLFFSTTKTNMLIARSYMTIYTTIIMSMVLI